MSDYVSVSVSFADIVNDMDSDDTPVLLNEIGEKYAMTSAKIITEMAEGLSSEAAQFFIALAAVIRTVSGNNG